MFRAVKFIAFLAIVLVVNWPYVYREVLDEKLGGSLALTTLLASEVPPPTESTFAGWPCKFYQSNAIVGQASLTSFSWLAAFMNVGFWLLTLAAMLLYQGFYERPQTHPDGTARKSKNLRLSDIFVGTALVALAFAFWQAMRQRADVDLKLAQRIVDQGGSVRRSASLPWLAREALRAGGFGCYLRISDVRLLNPNDELLKSVADLPSLRVLNIAGTYS